MIEVVTNNSNIKVYDTSIKDDPLVNKNVNSIKVNVGKQNINPGDTLATGHLYIYSEDMIHPNIIYLGVNNQASIVWLNYDWSNTPDNMIESLIAQHYAGTINLYDIWDVGQTRTVQLSAMPAGNFIAHAAQNVTFKLAKKGGKTLKTPINGHTECVFTFTTSTLNEVGSDITFVYNPSEAISHGYYPQYPLWTNCLRRQWCNTTYKNAIPAYLRNVLKSHNVTNNSAYPYIEYYKGNYGLGPVATISINNSSESGDDYLSFPSYIECGGTDGNRVLYRYFILESGSQAGYPQTGYKRSVLSSGITEYNLSAPSSLTRGLFGNANTAYLDATKMGKSSDYSGTYRYIITDMLETYKISVVGCI